MRLPKQKHGAGSPISESAFQSLLNAVGGNAPPVISMENRDRRLQAEMPMVAVPMPEVLALKEPEGGGLAAGDAVEFARARLGFCPDAVQEKLLRCRGRRVECAFAGAAERVADRGGAAESGDGARSVGGVAAVVDEAARMSEEMYQPVKPMLAVTDGDLYDASVHGGAGEGAGDGVRAVFGGVSRGGAEELSGGVFPAGVPVRVRGHGGYGV